METEKPSIKPVKARIGKDVVRARIWVEVDGTAEDVALIVERFTAAVAGPQRDEDFVVDMPNGAGGEELKNDAG